MAEDEENGESTENQAEQTGDATQDMGQGNKKRKMLFMIIGLVLVLVLGGGAAFFLIGTGSSEEDDAAMTESASSASDQDDGEASDEKTEESSDAEGEDAEGDGDDTSEKESAEDEPSEKIDFGQTFAFEPFNVNLGNPLENRFVRIEITLEFSGGQAQQTEITSRTPQLRDAIITIVGRKTREFLLSPDGKDQLRKEIFTRVNRFTNKPIDAVYITDLLIE